LLPGKLRPTSPRDVRVLRFEAHVSAWTFGLRAVQLDDSALEERPPGRARALGSLELAGQSEAGEDLAHSSPAST
jgi:hypothetical protein